MSDAALEDCLEKKGTTVCNNWIDLSELRINFVVDGNSKDMEVASSGPVLVILSTKRDQELLDEGNAREVINRIQKMRKKAGLVPTDQVTVYYEADGQLSSLLVSHKSYIQKSVRTDLIPLKEAGPNTQFLLKESFSDVSRRIIIS